MPSPEALEKHYIDKVHENGYLSVGFDIGSADIDSLFADFREFSHICFEEGRREFADALNFTVREKDGDYWMLQRRIGQHNPFLAGRAPATEDKDVAHIGPLSLHIADGRLGNRMPNVMRQFLESCIDLHEAAKASVRPVFKALGVEKIILAPQRLDDVHIVRVLHYLGTAATHQADLHFDRSKFTLAAWESSPGLVGAPGNNAYLKPLTVDELDEMALNANNNPIRHYGHSAKLFAGAGYNRLPDKIREGSGNLPLLLHGVNNQNTGEERDAVVVFMNNHLDIPSTCAEFEETGFSDIREYVLRRERSFSETA